MARTKIKEFPFIHGQREDADGKMLPDGYPVRVKNMRLRKDARWGVRYDYDALGRRSPDVVAVSHTDLVTFDGRLLATGIGVTGDTAAGDLYEFVNQPQFEWNGTDSDNGQVRAPTFSRLRDMGRPPLQSASVTRLDCAAGGGLVCLAYQSGSNTIVHVFDPVTDGTVLIATQSNLSKPRAIAVGSVFWIVGVSAAGTEIELYSYDPATDDALQIETDVSGVGAAITCYDARVNVAGNGFWVAVHRVTPTTQLIPVNSSGVAGTPITGPVTAFTHVGVCDTSTRVHLIAVRTATLIPELNSYTLAGALSTGPTTGLLFGFAAASQPGIAPDGDGTGRVNIVASTTSGTSHGRVVSNIVNATTHAIEFVQLWTGATLGTKPCDTSQATLTFGFGGVHADGAGFSNLLGSTAQTIGAYKDKFAAVQPNVDHIPAIAVDSLTGLFYWPNLTNDGDGRAQPVVTEFSYASAARKQTAELGGLLYIAGGHIYCFDGRMVFDAGFVDTPRIVSATPSNGAGALPSSTSLLIAATYEWRDSKGNFHTSRPSLVTTVTMGAADDTITVSVSGAHTMRRNTSSDLTAGAYRIVLWRSVSGINQLRRAEVSDAPAFGIDQSVTMLLSDTVVRANGVIYTQSARGILSAVEPHESPDPAEFICRFGKRLLTAGGPNRYRAQVSKELFPGEPVNWSGHVGFYIHGPDTAINGVAALGNRGLLFTATKIYQFSGDGPNDNGEGKYTDATEIDGSIGLTDWRSLVNTPLGVMFQGSDGQLWLLPTDGSPPVSFTQVQDTLIAFPTVTSATISTDEQLVSFTCNNSGGTDSRIVSFDLQAKTWIVDEFAVATPITAAVSYQGRLVYLSAGIAYRERSTHPPAAFIPHGITTGDLKIAGGVGWKQFCADHLIGEIRGDVNLGLRISYDSGVNWTTLTTVHELRTASLPAGSIVRRSWAPLIRKCERARLDFQANTGGTATEGFVFNGHGVEYVPQQGPARLGSTKRG